MGQRKVDSAEAIRGLHSVTLASAIGQDLELMTRLLGYTGVDEMDSDSRRGQRRRGLARPSTSRNPDAEPAVNGWDRPPRSDGHSY